MYYFFLKTMLKIETGNPKIDRVQIEERQKIRIHYDILCMVICLIAAFVLLIVWNVLN